tara:strand:- start:7 stop:297 length:291 start_codon:yes stop_codon:yes gene_type:complete
MKITKTQLKQIIKEEIETALKEYALADDGDAPDRGPKFPPGAEVRKRKSPADAVAPEGRIVGSPEQRGDELIYKVRWTKHGQGQPARVPESALESM